MLSSSLPLLLLFLLLLPALSTAQFQFFEQMFSGGSQPQQPQQQQQQNVASDSNWYRKTYDSAYCSNYLCPGTLACVHFAHHCPCAFPATEDKFELGDGSAVCVSKGGWKAGETARKVEVARKGLM